MNTNNSIVFTLTPEKVFSLYSCSYLSLSLVAVVNNHTYVAIVLIEKSANVKHDLIQVDYGLDMMKEKETGSEEMERGSGKRDEDYNHSSIANSII
jgi:hypothetical protein